MTNTMPLADFPKTGRVRVGRDAFEHHHRRSLKQRPVSQVTVARDPTDIRSAPKHIPWRRSKNLGKGICGVHHVPTGAVQDAFGLAGRTRGVKYKKGVFGIHPTGLGSRCGLVPEPIPIPTLNVRKRSQRLGWVKTPLNQDLAHRMILLGLQEVQGFFDHGPAGQVPGAATDFFRTYHHSRPRIRDPVGQTAGRKAPKDHRMHRTQPGTGQHRP